jgi:hypothetical protein
MGRQIASSAISFVEVKLFPVENSVRWLASGTKKPRR